MIFEAESNNFSLYAITVKLAGPAPKGLLCETAGPDKIIDGGDLISAIQRYASDDISAGELIEIIQYYASRTPCDRPLAGSGGAAGSSASVTFSVAKIVFSQNPATAKAIAFANGLGIESIRLEIFNLAGMKVFDSGFVLGESAGWHLQNSNGRTVSNGVYLYMITAKGFNGKIRRSNIRTLIVLR